MADAWLHPQKTRPRAPWVRQIGDLTQMHRIKPNSASPCHLPATGHALPRFACGGLSVLISALLATGLSVEAATTSYAAGQLPRAQARADTARPSAGRRTSSAATNLATGDFRLPVPAPSGLSAVLWQRFNPPPQNWLSGHRGVDLLARPGDPVYAPAAGVVSVAGTVGGKPVVAVTHEDGLRSTFEPVLATVKKGTVVAAGSQIGTVGFWPAGTASHCPTSPLGACVHWGVLRGSIYLDPLSLLGKAPPIVLLPL